MDRLMSWEKYTFGPSILYLSETSINSCLQAAESETGIWGLV